MEKVWDSVQPSDYSIQRYGMQILDTKDHTDSGLVSDTALADGWLYANLVHTNPFVAKAKALYFSLDERYLAAVSVFSNLAIYVLNLLEYIKTLHLTFNLGLEQKAWDCAVVVGNTHRSYENFEIYLAEQDTAFPDIKSGLATHPDWTLFQPFKFEKPTVHVKFLDSQENLIREIHTNHARYQESLEKDALFIVELEDAFSVELPVKASEVHVDSADIRFRGTYKNNHQLQKFIELERLFSVASKIYIQTVGFYLQLETSDNLNAEYVDPSPLIDVLEDIKTLEEKLEVELPL